MDRNKVMDIINLKPSIIYKMDNSGVEFYKLNEAGHDEAMIGLSLNKNQPLEEMPRVANKLAPLGRGHNKFLESIDVWLLLRVPRYVWQDFDTYRLTTKQSESTNHTILKRPLEPEDFEGQSIEPAYLNFLNSLIRAEAFDDLKRRMPEGFLQYREWKLNYQNIRNILSQRKNHKLKVIRDFCKFLYRSLKYSCYVRDIMED